MRACWALLLLAGTACAAREVVFQRLPEQAPGVIHHVWGRPVGITVAPDGALLVSDDMGNAIWRVSYNRGQ